MNANPRERTLIVAQAGARGLQEAIAKAESCGDVTVLIDDRSLIECGRDVRVIEPEELVPDGVEGFGAVWDRDVASWLGKVFPRRLDEVPLAEVMWASVFYQPST